MWFETGAENGAYCSVRSAEHSVFRQVFNPCCHFPNHQRGRIKEITYKSMWKHLPFSVSCVWVNNKHKGMHLDKLQHRRLHICGKTGLAEVQQGFFFPFLQRSHCCSCSLIFEYSIQAAQILGWVHIRTAGRWPLLYKTMLSGFISFRIIWRKV